MACVLPFNNIVIGATTIGPDAFVYGSGQLQLAGQDSAVTTADGMIHNFRSSLTPSSSFELRGDQRAKDTGAPGTWSGQTWASLPGTITLGYVASRGATATTVKSFTGIISVEYDSSTNKSSVQISGCEETY